MTVPKPVSSNLNGVFARRQRREAKDAVLAGDRDRRAHHRGPDNVTVTPGSTDLVLSVTVPVIAPVPPGLRRGQTLELTRLRGGNAGYV